MDCISLTLKVSCLLSPALLCLCFCLWRCPWCVWAALELYGVVFLFSAFEVVCESVSAVGSYLLCFCQAAAKLHQIASRPWQFHSSQLTCRLYWILHKVLGKGKKTGFVKEKKNPGCTFSSTKSHGATQKAIQNTYKPIEKFRSKTECRCLYLATAVICNICTYLVNILHRQPISFFNPPPPQFFQ